MKDVILDPEFEYLRDRLHISGSRYVGLMHEGKPIRLHRLLINAKDGIDVDHINGNTLDNRISNLRLCNASQNGANRPKQSNNTSGYKGVTLHKPTGKWQAYIRISGSKKSLGLFHCIHSAARAYNTAAIKHFGEFARLNDIPIRT